MHQPHALRFSLGHAQRRLLPVARLVPVRRFAVEQTVPSVPAHAAYREFVERVDHDHGRSRLACCSAATSPHDARHSFGVHSGGGPGAHR
jgi:hypothetical protein